MCGGAESQDQRTGIQDKRARHMPDILESTIRYAGTLSMREGTIQYIRRVVSIQCIYVCMYVLDIQCIIDLNCCCGDACLKPCRIVE